LVVASENSKNPTAGTTGTNCWVEVAMNTTRLKKSLTGENKPRGEIKRFSERESGVKKKRERFKSEWSRVWNPSQVDC